LLLRAHPQQLPLGSQKNLGCADMQKHLESGVL
jgi:hypothetical protein